MALLLTQFCWGSAAVTNKLGLSGAGVLPLLFAFLRECIAAPVLFALLWYSKRRDGTRRGNEGLLREGNHDSQAYRLTRNSQLLLRFMPGFFIFLDQLCSLTGVMLADPVSAAAWQPSQVVFTMMISIVLGMEAASIGKILGAVFTIGGSLVLVFFDKGEVHVPNQSNTSQLGQLFFFVNCLASSLEVIFWRKLLRGASSPMAHISVMAESYLVAASLMAIACIGTSYSEFATHFFCPKCEGNAWHLPPKALLAVIYSVIFQTIVGYLSQAWALRSAEASLASLYATAQPIFATLVTLFFISMRINPGNVLTLPGWHTLSGGLLIVGGLLSAEYVDQLLLRREEDSSAVCSHCPGRGCPLVQESSETSSTASASSAGPGETTNETGSTLVTPTTPIQSGQPSDKSLVSRGFAHSV
eukprot:TRINITY_DN14621_c0_g1_i1.p1 TRINITY_DN14621_c0_g1~~TRINITY_DN14621_c0_g1_i1.p1  ORF type:complete len:415 (+),score=46.82 TRINITY_DN14621_c0_g1_i1:114-1358(+)